MEYLSKNDRGENPEKYKDWQTIGGIERKQKSKEELKEEEIIEDLKPAKFDKFQHLKPEWIIGLEDAEAIWSDFVSEFLKAELEQGKGESEIFAEYYEQYYLMILGELSDRYLPKTPMNAHDGFGYEFWEDEFYAGGDHSKFRAAQYLSPRNILEDNSSREAWQSGFSHAIRSAHFNLCGQLAVIEGMGIGLTEGFRIFYEEVDDRDRDGKYILGNSAVGTYASDLIYFISAIAKRRSENWQVEHFYSENKNYRAAFLEALLEQQDIVIVLVNIDPSPAGEGILSDQGRCPHWVVLQDLFDLAGKCFVRLYNPFLNREEVYLWKIFEKALESAELNSAPRGIFGIRKN